MKLRIAALAFTFAATGAACGGGSDEGPGQASGVVKEAAPAGLPAADLATTTTEAPASMTSMDVANAFKVAGLEAEQLRPLTRDDLGMAPMKFTTGTRFIIPSLGKLDGEGKGGRIFTFDNDADLADTKEYYDSLGRESAALFSWTFANKRVLVQINGDLSDAKAQRYEQIVKSL